MGGTRKGGARLPSWLRRAPRSAWWEWRAGRAVVVSVIGALLCTAVLEASMLYEDPLWKQWVRTQLIDGYAFWVDALLVWTLVVAVWALVGRLWVVLAGFGALSLVLSAVNRTKVELRQEPVYPSDLDFVGEAGFLSTQVTTSTVVDVLVAAGAVVVVVLALGRVVRRWAPALGTEGLPGQGRRIVLAFRGAVLVTCVALLLPALSFHDDRNPWRGLYEVGGVWRPWNQATNYRANGVLGGYLYNLPIAAMPEPEGYGEEAMAEIAERYGAVADSVNAQRTGSLDDVNVVLVLSESFSDPTALDGFELERDPIPLTRETMAGTTAGEMLAQLYGGGTANMEFEAMTGQSLALFRPQLTSPYQMLVPSYEDYPSAVGWFESQGHESLAVHPFSTGMYRRGEVYRVLGFDGFLYQGNMANRESVAANGFISDRSAFTEVLQRIQGEDGPLFVNLVTMQNHIPVQGNYPDPLAVEGADAPDLASRIGQYARGLEETDEALAAFLATLEETTRTTGEETVVLFYGDHLPGIYDDTVTRANPGTAMYETPWFAWSSAGNTADPQPLTSAAHFMPLAYQVADAPVPPYYALLDAVRAEIGAMEQGRFVTPEGEVLRRDELDAEARQVLDDLTMVQYDFTLGERYALDDMWPGAAAGAPATP